MNGQPCVDSYVSNVNGSLLPVLFCAEGGIFVPASWAACTLGRLPGPPLSVVAHLGTLPKDIGVVVGFP